MCPVHRFLFLVVIWITSASTGAASLNWHGITEVAHGPGEKGPWQQNDSRYRYVDDPAVLVDTEGNVSVAWVNQSVKGVFFQRYAVDGQPQLPQPINVSRNPDTFSWLPRLAQAPDAAGRIYVLWQEIIFSGGSHGGDMLFARSDDHGQTFTRPINLSRSKAGAGKGRINAEVWDNGSFDLAAGPNGVLYVTWTEYEGRLWFIRSNDGGNSFSQARLIDGGEGENPARAPSLAVAQDGKIYLTWTHGEKEDANIQLAYSSDGGANFSSPAAIAPSQHYADAPKIAVGPGGDVHLAYAQSHGGPFSRYRIHYTRSSDGGRSFRPAQVLSHPMPASAESAHYPALEVDASGRVYVSYELYPDHRSKPRGLGISLSSDEGNNFSRPMAIPNSADAKGGFNGSQQGKLMNKLAANRNGRITIANSSLQQNEQSRVWLIHGTVTTESSRRE